MIIGIGTDLVGVQSFTELLDTPGTVFGDAFTGTERRAAKNRGGESGDEAAHLAARWAVKESVIKAWSSALLGHPPAVAKGDFAWADIELLSDRWGRPEIMIHEPLRGIFTNSLTARFGAGTSKWHVSLSHDEGFATATVILEWNPVRQS